MNEENEKSEENSDDQPLPVRKEDLPLHCPPQDSSLWNSHPRIFLAIEASGRAKCPYCGAEYILVDT